MKIPTHNICIAIALLGFCIGCEKEKEKYIKDHRSELLSVTGSISNIEADGKSTILFTALIPDYAKDKTVKFFTNAGVFLENKTGLYIDTAAMKEGKLQAAANLQSTLEPTVDVRVKVSSGEVDSILRVSFITALPDSLQLESTVASVSKGFGSEVPVQALLIRKIGIPSLRQLVSFEAKTELGQTIGEFRGIDPAGSNEKGLVSSVFVLKDTSYTGKVHIIGKATGKTKLLIDTLNVFITK